MLKTVNTQSIGAFGAELNSSTRVSWRGTDNRKPARFTLSGGREIDATGESSFVDGTGKWSRHSINAKPVDNSEVTDLDISEIELEIGNALDISFSQSGEDIDEADKNQEWKEINFLRSNAERFRKQAKKDDTEADEKQAGLSR